MTTRNLQCTFAFSMAVLLAGCGGGDDAETDVAGTSSARQAVEQPAPERSTDRREADRGEAARLQEMDEPSGPGRESDGEPAQIDQAMASTDDAASEQTQAGSTGDSGDPCVLDINVGDSISFGRDSITVPSSCDSVTVNLTHTGSLPKEAMGHNWVLVPASAAQAIGNAGTSAGIENGYLPDDDRIVAATDLIGGGDSTSLTFSLNDLEEGTAYEYICTFPGHWTVMRGSFSVE